MFFAKKLITSLLVPPGLFISLLLLFSLFSKRRVKLIFFAALIYIFSIEPVKDIFMRPLEESFSHPEMEKIRMCDAYVVLGSGVKEGVPDLSGVGELTEDACERVVNALRLYTLVKKPIILTGGSIYKRDSEAPYAKRFLLHLGVKENDIIVEAKSKDTKENALYTKKIAEEMGIKRIVLITNAYHMRRAYSLFSRYFHVVPMPVGYKTSKRPYDPLSYLPDASNLKSVSIALKEYFGLLHLRIFFKD